MEPLAERRAMALLNVEVENGKLEGILCGDGLVSSFKGIPYAAPPVGDLRWKEPQPIAWSGVKQAYCFAPAAMQLPASPDNFYYKEFSSIFPMSEDCLYLNVWTSAEKSDEKLPVAFWVYGGGFQAGSSRVKAYYGEDFARKGVVFVSVGYRLNIFGFLAHPELTAESEHHSSGNYGMLDQIFALQWVKRNIAAFGGDPENITVFGQSAGAGSTIIHTTSPLTKGLFQRAIVQSAGGIEVRERPPLAEMEQRGIDFLRAAGLTGIEEARKLSAEKLLETYDQVNPKRERWKLYGPNVDHYLLDAEPIDVILAGKHHDLDYMWGSTAEEGNSYGPAPDCSVATFEMEAKNVYRAYANAYLRTADAKSEEKVRYVQKYNMANGALARCVGFAERQVEQERRPCYQYYFTRRPPGDDTGAFHSAEHAYVFQTFPRIWRPYTGVDFELSQIMSSYWVNFIRCGDPNGAGLPEWKPFTEHNRMTMELGDEVGMIPVPETPISKFQKEFIYHQLGMEEEE